MEYVDFVVSFEPPGADGYPVAAVDSPAGQARSPVRLHVAQLFCDLPDLGRQVRRSAADAWSAPRELGEPTGQGPPQIGAELHRALITGEVQRLFAMSRGIAAARGAGLRLGLKFDLGNPALAQLARLPWELLYDEDKGRFLARGDRRLLIVRSLSVPEFAPELGGESPLRVLAAVASPVDLPPLNLEEERRLVSQTLAGRGGIEIEFLEQANLSALRERVLASGCQALHFMGHGQFEPKTGEGMIALAGKDGKKQLVPGSILAQHLGDLGLRLVVLNACRTAEVADGGVPDPFAGVAAALVREGLTAAVAMQFPISDSAAIRFTVVFYQRLAASDPVDVAVSEARLALQTADPNSLEWATPVLYLRFRANQLVMRPPLLRRAVAQLSSWFRPVNGEGWVEHLLQFRLWRLPVGRWLVAFLCTVSQALVWFYLVLLAVRASGFFEGLGAVLTPFALLAPILALRCGLALPPRLGRWTAVFAFLLAASVWLFLDSTRLAP